MTLKLACRMLQKGCTVEHLGGDSWRIAFRPCDMYPGGLILWGNRSQLERAIWHCVELTRHGWSPVVQAR